MRLTYEQYLQDNRRTSRESTVYLLHVDNEKNTVDYMTKSEDRQYFRVPTEILILEMENDMVHINDAARLRGWGGWGTDIDYPADYFDNMDKYFTELDQYGDPIEDAEPDLD
ncbi:MAG: hypothetical protein IKM88_01090 [Lachnospiraceae bacterium]|nr:hypothetical protein [Lachnospiraceae bacterium]MBR3736982.1 hypothetical protein [Lachnospiraceae bacterium]MBR6848817.1 hypothetical protein [Lachnospiraceae bacterium]